MRGVGRGGKTLLGQQRGQGFHQFFLIAFDRQEVVAPLGVKNLPHGLDLRVSRVRQHDFPHHVQLRQLCARRRNFIALGFNQRGTQPATTPADRTHGRDARVPDRLTVQNDDLILHRPQHLLLP